MNTKTLFKLVTMLAILMVLVAGNAFAAKYYVNVVTGLDGYDGLSPLFTSGATGPKYTINNAITAASPGDTIVVDYGNGNLYNEVVNANKLLVFASSNNTGTGVPVVYGLNINNAVAAPNNVVKFISPFSITSGMTLTVGVVTGASNLTVATSVTRVIAASTVDAQLNYSGTVNFFYNATMTTGLEMVSATNTSNAGDITTTAGTLTLGHNVTMSGTLTTAGPLDIVAGQTLAITSGSGAKTHVVAGNVTNGTLAFTVGSGGVTVNGNFDLPTVTATASAANLLTLNTTTKIGDITAGGSVLVTVASAVGSGVGNVTNNGSGTIALTLATATKSLTNTSSGQITPVFAGLLTVTGNVTQSGTGKILFVNAVTITGSVTQNAALAFNTTSYTAASNRSAIRFGGDFAVTIGGSVTNTTSFSGASTSTVTSWVNVGEISFGATTAATAITGAVVVNPSHTMTYGGTTGSTFNNNGGITFASTTGAVTVTGGISNSTNWTNPTTTGNWAMSGCGDVNMSARTAGVLTVGALTSTSLSPTATGQHGNILLGGTTGNVVGSSITTSGGTGGRITINGSSAVLNFSGTITNSRTTAATYLTIGNAVTAGASVSIGGDLVQNGAATTSFGSFNGGAGEGFTVTGALNVSAGSVLVNAGAQTGAGAFTFGTVTITGGTVDIGAAASVMNIIVQGNATFTAGTWKSGGAVGRTLRLGGLVNKFSAPSNRTDFVSGTNMANVLLLLQPVSVVALQTFTGDATQTIWPGPMQVVNGSGLTPAAKFTGGNFRFLGNVQFTTGQVEINGVTLFIGGQLAPYVGAGNFENVAGYITSTVGTQNGFVSMNGNAAQSVTVASVGTFWNFEVDNAAGVTMNVAAKFKGTFNLTKGAVTNPGFIDFDNTTTPPTIVVNAGNFFAAPPVFTSMVSVYYIGVDKATGNELPLAADKLFNLTVATTNGTNVIGKGVVAVNVATTVNGTLNIFAGQALNMVGPATLTMLGPTVTLNGDLAGDLTTNILILNAPTGTTITGPGALPNVQVWPSSVGNSINGSVGLAVQLLGVDQIRGTDDNLPGNTGASAAGIVATAGAASSLTVAFGTPNATTGAHLDYLQTLAASNCTITLGADLIQAGILSHQAGTISTGTFTYTLLNTLNLGAHDVNSAAAFAGTGTLQFKLGASTNLNMSGGAGVIATNVKLLNPANVAAYTLTLTGNDLTIAGNLTLQAGGAVGTTTFALGALNLTVTGSAVTMNTNSSITGTGVVTFNATTAPLTFTYTGAPTIANLTIKNDVVLAGTGTGLVITGIFDHTAGNLNFGARDLTVGALGTYTRTAGTYTATTGYFIFSGTTFNQGATGYSIPNLRFTNTGAVTAGGTGVVLVTTALDVNTVGGFTHAGTLSVADGANVYYTQGAFDVEPVYVGTINLYAYNVGTAIDATVWPATPATLVKNFIVDNGGGNVNLPGDRTVNNYLSLTTGNLQLLTRTLTMVNNSTVYRYNTGSVNATTGGLAYGTGMTVVYYANGGMGTGLELPANIANLTFTRSANVGNAWTTINTNVTVTGLLSIRNNVTDIGGTLMVNAAGNVEILNESATYSAATNPVVTLTNLTFSGTGNQLFTVAANGATVFNLRIAQAGTGSTVTITGGPLTVGGTLSFVNGILVSGTYPIVLGGLVDRTGLTGLSHIYGTVQRTIATLGRFEYPVGSMTKYRPMSITFPTVIPPAVGLTVQHVDSDPLGTLGLPVADAAAGIRIGGYPKYYWLVSSTISLGQSIPYDLELVGTNPFGRPFNRADDLRIIHRFDGDDLYNPWSLQGTGALYSNFLAQTAGDTVVTVRVRGQVAGIVPEKSRYDIGIPTRPPVWTAAATALTVNEGAALSQQFTADPQDVGETMAYTLTTAPAGMTISATGLLTWTPGYDQAGVKNVVISATDGEFTITANVAVTVVNVNRAPVFAPKTASFTKTDKDTVKVALAATDADNDALTYSVGTITPAATNAPAVAGTQLTWKPTFADAGKTFTITAIVSDGIATGQGPLPGRDTLTVTVVVNRSRALGDADGNGTVQAADASVVLQYVAGLTTVTDPAALWAMDASKNGTITAYDASLILQAAAGLIPPLTGNMSDDGLSKGVAMQATGVLEVASPEATTNPEVVKVGIKLSNPANVYSVALTTKGDFSLVSIDAVNASLPEGWDMKWNVTGNELRIAAAGTTPLSSGDVASIMVHLKSKESRLSFSTDAMLNENFQSLGAVEVAAVPTVYALDQNYPNPFNPSTTIRYQIPTDASVTLDVFNVKGQKIRTLVSKEQKAGYYSVVWDGRNEAGQTVSTGLYLYRVQAGSFVATQKMLMLK